MCIFQTIKTCTRSLGFSPPASPFHGFPPPTVQTSGLRRVVEVLEADAIANEIEIAYDEEQIGTGNLGQARKGLYDSSFAQQICHI